MGIPPPPDAVGGYIIAYRQENIPKQPEAGWGKRAAGDMQVLTKLTIQAIGKVPADFIDAAFAAMENDPDRLANKIDGLGTLGQQASVERSSSTTEQGRFLGAPSWADGAIRIDNDIR